MGATAERANACICIFVCVFNINIREYIYLFMYVNICLLGYPHDGMKTSINRVFPLKYSSIHVTALGNEKYPSKFRLNILVFICSHQLVSL